MAKLSSSTKNSRRRSENTNSTPTGCYYTAVCVKYQSKECVDADCLSHWLTEDSFSHNSRHTAQHRHITPHRTALQSFSTSTDARFSNSDRHTVLPTSRSYEFSCQLIYTDSWQRDYRYLPNLAYQ